MSETELRTVPGWPAHAVESLAKAWITTADQVVATAATAGGVRSLAQQLHLSEPETLRLVELARAALPAAERAAMNKSFSSNDRGMGAISPGEEEKKPDDDEE